MALEPFLILIFKFCPNSLGLYWWPIWYRVSCPFHWSLVRTCISLKLIRLGWLLFAGWRPGPDSLKQHPGKLEGKRHRRQKRGQMTVLNKCTKCISSPSALPISFCFSIVFFIFSPISPLSPTSFSCTYCRLASVSHLCSVFFLLLVLTCVSAILSFFLSLFVFLWLCLCHPSCFS